jgi:hypothetical protein
MEKNSKHQLFVISIFVFGKEQKKAIGSMINKART